MRSSTTPSTNWSPRPVGYGPSNAGDSFVVAFARASDAVACALQLQLAVLAIRIRIGLHTGGVQLRDAATTPDPPSTGPHECATWHTAGKRCCPGDRFTSRYSRTFLSSALTMQGKLAEGVLVLRALVEEARAAGDHSTEVFGLITLAQALALTGDAAAARESTQAALDIGASLDGFHEDSAYAALATAALDAGDVTAAKEAYHAARRHTYPLKELLTRCMVPTADAAAGCGDLVAGRRWADDAVALLDLYPGIVDESRPTSALALTTEVRNGRRGADAV